MLRLDVDSPVDAVQTNEIDTRYCVSDFPSI